MGPVVQGFFKSLAMTVLSEIGDNTFFAAAILAMRHPRRLVLSGCMCSLIVMTILSAIVGWAAPNVVSKKWTHHITTLLFFVFGLLSFKDAIFEEEEDELAEVEAKLNEEGKANNGATKDKNKVDDDLKRHKRPFFSQFFSPIFLKAFSITFFGEWGDRSQVSVIREYGFFSIIGNCAIIKYNLTNQNFVTFWLATIGLAADENAIGVVLGGILGQALCTVAAVVGGKSLASRISEKVALSSGILFIIFGFQSFFSPIES